MSTFHLGRRSALAGSAAAAVVPLPKVSRQAQAAAPVGVAKSGCRWRRLMGGTGFITGTPAVDPAHPNGLYLALGTYTGSWAGNGAVHRSEARGATWKPVPGQPTGTAAKVPIRAAHDRYARELYVTYADSPSPNGRSYGRVHKLRNTDGKRRGGSCRAAHTLGFGKAAKGSDDEAQTWVRFHDDRHQRGWIGHAITGDPRVHGRVFVATNGRGVQYGEIA
ncbi:hypothetical protein [Streptomyces sp. NPDC097610]|uniref:hypothetical protein n=1 Tax=Streptomyces sp. NPDC097610 TaxID=3157227 RepID=UPI00332705B5